MFGQIKMFGGNMKTTGDSEALKMKRNETHIPLDRNHVKKIRLSMANIRKMHFNMRANANSSYIYFRAKTNVHQVLTRIQTLIWLARADSYTLKHAVKVCIYRNENHIKIIVWREKICMCCI